MTDLECPNCDCEDLYEGPWMDVWSFVCRDCGVIFIPEPETLP